MLVSLRENGLTSLFKEVRGFKVSSAPNPANPWKRRKNSPKKEGKSQKEKN